MIRIVEPEWLDELPTDDRSAVHSRRDLRRVNAWMGHGSIFRNRLGDLTASAPRRVVELGAGDGTLLLKLASQWPNGEGKTTACLVDRQNLVSGDTLRAFAVLGWEVQTEQSDVIDWLGQPGPSCDWMMANLFLHHFSFALLSDLLRLASARCGIFIACEPRRAALPMMAARLLGVIGCNGVTRHDARVSVRAGFQNGEISALWPQGPTWKVWEGPAGLFSHAFVAQRMNKP